MYINQTHSKSIISYDLTTKFTHKNSYLTPKLEKVVLNFGTKEVSLKLLALTMAALEMVSAQTPKMTQSKKSNIFLKIRKGAPVGCRVLLRNKFMSFFLFKTISNVLPNIKLFEGVTITKSLSTSKSFSFSLYDLLIFLELENQYTLFQKMPKMDISVVSTVRNFQKSKVLLTGSRFLFKA
jgi:large subunit ribosomal protein L5